MKRGFFFSTDALIALMIIFGIIIIAYPIAKYKPFDMSLHEDSLKVLSSIKIGDIQNPYVYQLISDGKITNLNQSVLEQIGEFYAKEMPEAETLTQNILLELSSRENLGLWFNNQLIYSDNKSSFENSKKVWTSRQIISGIEKGEAVKGYSSRAFLSKANRAKYFYFGGYIGDGNITAKVDYEGGITNIKMEIATNKDFDVYINDIFSGHYQNSSSDIFPSSYDLGAYLSNFQSGQNKIKFIADNLHIAGGYIKILYSDNYNYSETKRYYFPGIEGFINLYDGFYVPGNLSSLDVRLHINSNYTTFLLIGNAMVYNGTTSGEETITLANSQLSQLLNYQSLSKITTPLRLGLENASYIGNVTKKADVFSVTDLSGSMRCPVVGGVCPLSQFYCESVCGGNWLEPINNAKDANKAFINSVLNYSGNRVGLVGYANDASDFNYHALSNDSVLLNAKVDGWEASGSTCICCGINKAVDNLVSYSSADKFRSIVVMSDGEATISCAEQGTGDAKQDAIQSACEAYNNGIIVHAIGFGSDADEETLRAISACGNGNYYYSNISDLIDIYKQVAEDIIEASYSEQTIEVSGNLHTILYPDSYIEFDYEEEELPYGLITTSEKQFSDSYYGYFDLPENSEILKTEVISYSGSKWTDNVEINNISIYKLSNYGADYIKLGDPYVINIPNDYVQKGNTIKLTTGVYPGNSSQGSIYNKIFYTFVQEALSYSEIVASASGCIWHIEFEDSSLTINVPSNYPGAEECYYTSGSLAYNNNDAINNAVYKLFSKLDLDSNNKIDVKFSEQDLKVDSLEISGIPFTWSTEAQVRVWR